MPPEDEEQFPFRKDLIIATFDPEKNTKVLYQVPEKTWRSQELELPADGDLAAILEPMLNAGCVLATVPVTNIQQGGASCYLLSLAGLDVDPFKKNQGPDTE